MNIYVITINTHLINLWMDTIVNMVDEICLVFFFFENKLSLLKQTIR